MEQSAQAVLELSEQSHELKALMEDLVKGKGTFSLNCLNLTKQN